MLDGAFGFRGVNTERAQAQLLRGEGEAEVEVFDGEKLFLEGSIVSSTTGNGYRLLQTPPCDYGDAGVATTLHENEDEDEDEADDDPPPPYTDDETSSELSDILASLEREEVERHIDTTTPTAYDSTNLASPPPLPSGGTPLIFGTSPRREENHIKPLQNLNGAETREHQRQSKLRNPYQENKEEHPEISSEFDAKRGTQIGSGEGIGRKPTPPAPPATGRIIRGAYQTQQYPTEGEEARDRSPTPPPSPQGRKGRAYQTQQYPGRIAAERRSPTPPPSPSGKRAYQTKQYPMGQGNSPPPPEAEQKERRRAYQTQEYPGSGMDARNPFDSRSGTPTPPPSPLKSTYEHTSLHSDTHSIGGTAESSEPLKARPLKVVQKNNQIQRDAEIYPASPAGSPPVMDENEDVSSNGEIEGLFDLYAPKANEASEEEEDGKIHIAFDSYRFDTSQLYYNAEGAFKDTEPTLLPGRFYSDNNTNNTTDTDGAEHCNSSFGPTTVHNETGDTSEDILFSQSLNKVGGGTPETRVVHLDFSQYRDMDTSYLYHDEEATGGVGTKGEEDNGRRPRRKVRKSVRPKRTTEAAAKRRLEGFEGMEDLTSSAEGVVGRCLRCNKDDGVAYCTTCTADNTNSLCVSCWWEIHRSPALQQHRPHFLTMCAKKQCSAGNNSGDVSPALWRCADCKIDFCKTCWQATHFSADADYHLRTHKPINIFETDNSPLLLNDSPIRPAPTSAPTVTAPQWEEETLRTGVDPSLRYRLMNFFSVRCPQKLPSVMPTLRQFKGDEEAMFHALTLEYGAEPKSDYLSLRMPEGWKVVQTPSGDVFYLHTSGEKQWQHPAHPTHAL